ncbi:histidine phosphatase family protein [Amycolatopsis rhabdoformis]|uniref:Histidine phosphatase family protein n=1 Tax=Amycolatopsis rhabdoformis TaxID=1448059 RepID=A0ABZ1IKK9_9PSEU|nr:histidine phosphatase family protein [Amycolatopsis rhabdoformis]WSE34753.1 histidine phosphatase family protein [Amycolatopsis rhabdoformis]
MGILLLVRHGQASFGAADYDRLSTAGHHQARRAGAALAAAGLVPTRIVQGTLRRHRETTAAITEGGGWHHAATDDADWNEFDHLAVLRTAGYDLETLTDRRTFQAAFDKAVALWHADHGGPWPERWPGFAARTTGALARAAATAGPGEVVLVVSSAGPIAAACAADLESAAEQWHLLDAERWRRFNTVLVNTSLTRILVGTAGPRLLTFNEHQHLTATEVTYR